jgi:hypothetical protein
MPKCVTDSIEMLGFKVERILTSVPINIGDLTVMLFAADDETIIWEKRVTALRIAARENDSLNVFIAVDALISQEYKSLVEQGELEAPLAIVVSNNSSIVPVKGVDARTNKLPMENPHERVMPGLRLLYIILLDFLDGLPTVPNLIICGNGFVNETKPFGPYLFANNHDLARNANELAVDQNVFGPYPGEKIVVSTNKGTLGSVEWITLNKEAFRQLVDKQKSFIDEPFHVHTKPILSKFASLEEQENAIEKVEKELKYLARSLLVSPVGIAAININEYLNGLLGSKRIVFHFKVNNFGTASLIYAFDLASTSFDKVDVSPDDLMHEFPFGIEMHLEDFYGLITGKIQIWELAGTAIEHWYMSDLFSNVVASLFTIYGEQVRPDLASKIYNRALLSLDTIDG